MARSIGINVRVLHSGYLRLRIHQDVINLLARGIRLISFCEVIRCLESLQWHCPDLSQVIQAVHPAVNSPAAIAYFQCPLQPFRVLQFFTVSCSTIENTPRQGNTHILKCLAVIIKICKDIRPGNRCRPDHGSYSLRLTVKFGERVAVQLRNSLPFLKPRLNVCDRNNLICFIHIHGIHEKFDIPVMIKGFCLKII